MINILTVGRKCKNFSETFLYGISDFIYFSDKVVNISDGEQKKFCVIDVAKTDFKPTRFFDVIIIKNNDFKPFYPNEFLREGGLVFVQYYNKNVSYLKSADIQCIKFGSGEYDTITYTSFAGDSLRVGIQRPVPFGEKTLEIQEFNVPFRENDNIYAAMCAAVCTALAEKVADAGSI